MGGQRSDLLRKLLGCAAARCSGAVPWCCSTACCSLPSSRPAHASPPLAAMPRPTPRVRQEPAALRRYRALRA